MSKTQTPIRQFVITISTFDEGVLTASHSHDLIHRDAVALRDFLGAQTFKSTWRTDSAVAVHRVFDLLDGLIKLAEAD